MKIKRPILIKLADSSNAMANNQTFLTNAPRYLLKYYKGSPQVIIGEDCIPLRYGGGMYDWGLTIGATNLPVRAAWGGHVEQWWPGVYYWSN